MYESSFRVYKMLCCGTFYNLIIKEDKLHRIFGTQ